MIPASFIQELLSRLDIVDVVERYVPLKKSGANYVACCPFHQEKTPSFTVSPTKQFYHCFGCGAHGSAIGFVMQYKGLTFPEAVEELAGWLGLTVPYERGRAQGSEPARPTLAERMLDAARFYKARLKSSPHAIDYLKRRGLSGEIAARFHLGYAPDAWQALAEIFAEYDTDASLLACGLVIENEKGRRYDRFRDRIMFPIIDGKGAVIAFGGRTLGDGEPKYLNSPETPLFRKGEALYGLPQARQAIQAEGCALVVEGYMDVVALAQFGVGHAVATLGTATTPAHLKQLWRHTRRIVFCFDGDAAGRKAAWRALEAALPTLSDERSVGFLFLPTEDDPDSFIRREGAEAFRQLLQRPLPLSEFFLAELASPLDLASAEGKAELAHRAISHLSRLSAPLLRQQLIQALARRADLPAEEIARRAGLPAFPRRPAPPPVARMRTRPHGIERTLLAAVLDRPERAARIPLAWLANDHAVGAALASICEAICHGELPADNVGALLEHFRNTPHEELLAEMLAETEVEKDASVEMETVFLDALERLRERRLAQEIEALTAKARSTGLSAHEQRLLAQLLAQRKGRPGDG
ncbi:MAG: DNA primase [Rhodocyclaceae bacterium]|nr:DNA primase [Rhodocyclaceae bacterium]